MSIQVNFDELLAEGAAPKKSFTKDEIFILDEGIRRGVSYIKLAQVLSRNPASVRNFLHRHLDEKGNFNKDLALEKIEQKEERLVQQAENMRKARYPQIEILEEVLRLCKEILNKLERKN